jgi:hypothetical protein
VGLGSVLVAYSSLLLTGLALWQRVVSPYSSEEVMLSWETSSSCPIVLRDQDDDEEFESGSDDFEEDEELEEDEDLDEDEEDEFEDYERRSSTIATNPGRLSGVGGIGSR